MNSARARSPKTTGIPTIASRNGSTARSLERYFRQAYSKFLAAAAQLTAYSYEAFCGKNGWRVLDHAVFELNDAYEDRYGFYVYDRDRSEFRTEDAWLREADLSAPWYVGGIVDYHF